MASCVISRTPLRISFVGGGTDLPDFYRQYSGRVISTAIDKYIYIAANPKFGGTIRVGYSVTENVSHRNELQHTRAKAVLECVGIEKGIEIVSIADIPASGTGLGSSSSFTVGLLNALYAYLGQPKSHHELAREACLIEIEKLKEPIGKQDQYIASFGGFNLIEFNPDETVEIEPIYLDPETKRAFCKHLMLFYTGITRSSTPILSEQKSNIPKSFSILRQMSNMVPAFQTSLEKGDFEAIGQIFHEGWLLKKQLAKGISNSNIDLMYESARQAGAWGGKILGAGGGGFLFLFVPPEKQAAVRLALRELQEMPFQLVDAGSRIVFKG